MHRAADGAGHVIDQNAILLPVSKGAARLYSCARAGINRPWLPPPSATCVWAETRAAANWSAVRSRMWNAN